MQRLSRRRLIASAARAGVGLAGLVLVGCEGPEVYNAPGEAEPDPVEPNQPDPPAPDAVEQEMPEPVVEPSRPARSTLVASSLCGRVFSGSSLEELAIEFEAGPREVVDAAEWRERYHWRRLGELPAGTPRRGGELVLSTPSPLSWSPIPPDAYRAYASPGLLPLLYSQLVTLAAGDGEDAHRNEIEGDLAAGWETPDDATLIFRLRDGVSWPGGWALAASDVQATHALYREDGAPQSAAYRAVSAIEADDVDGSVKFLLREPSSFLLAAMTGPDHVVMPPGWQPAAEADGLATPPGTGPFMLDRWPGPDGTWRVARRTGYYRRDAATGEALPRLDAVSGGLRPGFELPNVCVYREDLWDDWLTGSLDALQLESPAELTATLAALPDAVAQVTAPSPGRGAVIEFPQDVARPISDPRARRALSLAIDRRAMIDDWHDGLAAADCGLNWTFAADAASGREFREWPWTLEELGPAYGHDPEGARALLEAAGHTREAPLRIGLDRGTTSASNIRSIGEQYLENRQLSSLAAELRSAFRGLIDLDVLDRQLTPTGTAMHPEANAMASAFSRGHPAAGDPSGFVPAESERRRWPRDAELERLWESARRTLDPLERSEVIEQIRARAADAMPAVHLVNRYGLHARRAGVFDLVAPYFAHDPVGAASHLSRAWKTR